MRIVEDRRPLRRSTLLLLLMSSHRCCAALVGLARKLTHTYRHALTLNKGVKGKAEFNVSVELVEKDKEEMEHNCVSMRICVFPQKRPS